MNYENILYNGDVTILYDSRLHRYFWEEQDEVITSVTTAQRIIDKPALVQWSANMAVAYISEQILPGKSYDEVELASIWNTAKFAHKERKQEAADLGTMLHKWIEDYINLEYPGIPVNPKLKRSVIRFLKWVKKHDVEFILAEQIVFSKKYKYAGTTDFICKIDGKLYIGDLKTSKGIYDTMLTQTAAYRAAREEEFPDEKYEGQLILRIGSDGTFETAYVRSDKAYKMLFKAFIRALNLSNSMEKVRAYRPERDL